jgi:transaldolase
MNIKLFADTANIDEISRLAREGAVSGFTTNPTLMRQAGVTSYETFAKALLDIVPDMPVSFEVFSDELPEMLCEAEIISRWAPNIYVKIPVTNTKGVSTVPVIRTLVLGGVKVNVTAILNVSDILDLVPLMGTVPMIVSVFAGRIADTGRDPCHHMSIAKHLLNDIPLVELLWASTREVWNIMQAERVHCDIITVTPTLLAKLGGLGRPLADLSLDTVKQFYRDAQASHYTLGGLK